MPLISVITVCFNSEKTIRRTIESVLNQTIKELEYIIVDGASKDHTLEIAKEYERAFWEKGYDYTIISEPDKGIYDAMNKGIRASKGEITGIINSDDWYEKNALERVSLVYKEKPFDMFYADLYIWKNENTRFIKHSRLRNPVVSRDWNHPTTFIKKEIYDKLGYYKLESLHDDWDFYLKVRNFTDKITVLNEPLANFTFGGISNKKSLKNSISRGKARYRIYLNNGYSRLYWFECVLIEAVKFIF